MVVGSYGKRGAEISKGIYTGRGGLTKWEKCGIIQSSDKQHKMNVLKDGGKEICYE
jgi:hypothetical protein